ncbi:YihY/virulence factor BrkB family protein [Actinomadura opuntiae]|uniref:YihY/virulence factor BrkB family protein n=1 Tax=Actinomadura sp. OS1-43 TaxID=604315 RepID=UPI00255B32F1|nr:YihY/virulence factor BrkB family protein [Actinomadura sp. OS1-43]MDL4821123.1 YihY/virulence factor BrkB family protein [Actinomadura sp. OS1-43]
MTTVSDAAGDSPARDHGGADGAGGRDRAPSAGAPPVPAPAKPAPSEQAAPEGASGERASSGRAAANHAAPDLGHTGPVRSDHAPRLVAGSAARVRSAGARVRAAARRAGTAFWGALGVLARSGGPVGWRLVKGTAVGAFRYRVTGLAAEIAFFALLSLPPLALGLIGTMGHFQGVIGPETVADIRTRVVEHAHTVLTDNAVKTVVVPLLDDVIRGGSPDIVSISFVLSLWAGSRAVNVCIDTITIAYGLSGIRGVIRTRTRAFILYVLGLVAGLVVVPLLVAGPTLARQALPESATIVQVLYWPVLVGLSVLSLALLYHMSVPVRTAWWREVPGAVLALLIWVIGSLVLRIYLSGSLSGVSVYGSLAAAIAVLAWLYVAALAVLIGATLNAEIDRLWPSAGTARARAVQEARARQEEEGDDGRDGPGATAAEPGDER